MWGDDERTGVFSDDPFDVKTEIKAEPGAPNQAAPPGASRAANPELDIPNTDKVSAPLSPSGYGGPGSSDQNSAVALPDIDEDQFPALQKLKRKKGGKLPYVAQLHQTDCGAASLSTVLAFYGREVSLDELRYAMGVDRNGVTAGAIAETAEKYGLQSRGITADVEDVKFLPPGTILHWEFNHFLVFDHVSRKGVHLVDPAAGRRTVSVASFSKSFTGIAILLEPNDAFETGSRKSPVWAYLRQLLGQTKILWRVVTTSVLLRLFALAVPILTAMIVDRVVPRDDQHLLTVVGAGLLGLVVFQFFADLIRAHLMLQLRTNLDTRMTLGFIDHLMGTSYEFIQQRSAGDLMMRVNSNATIREMLTTNTLTALLDGTLVFTYLAAILFFSPIMAAIALGLGVLQISLYLLSRNKIRDLMAENLEAQARSQSYLVQMLAGVQSIKTCGAESRITEHWSNLFVDELNVSLRRGRLDAVVNSAMNALRMSAPLVLLLYGAIEVMQGKMSLGSMLAVNALALAFLTPLSSLVNTALQLQLLGGYIDRIDDVLSAPPEQDVSAVMPAPKLKGNIAVERVSFRYGPNTPEVVQEVSLTIPAGKSVAIVGMSGSGKSTLATLLMGLYSPSKGRILYDSHDLESLDLRSVRRQLGIVPQHPYIFGGSIRENIALTDPDAEFDRIVDAARLANIHDDIIALPMGYESLVTDGGASMSGGQRQRLALARALLHRPAILLLDEATSALDATNEQRVMENLRRRKCTRIIIAHRLSTIADADEIVVMSEGKLVERGTHAGLLAQGGHYASLVAAQQDVADMPVAQ